MSGITSDELREWRELCERATPGPWAFTASAGDVFETLCTEDEDETPVLIGSEIGDGQCWFNWEFIATAREALPRCLAEIERLQAKVLTDCEEDRLIEFLNNADDGNRFAALCQFAARCGELRTEIDHLNRVIESMTTSHRGERS